MPPTRGTRLAVLLIVAAFQLPTRAGHAQAAGTQTATAQIVQAAEAFLATLDANQRKAVLFAFEDAEQRARWSNFPTGVVARGGISLREMGPPQRAAAMALLATALSPEGMTKVQQIMEADELAKADALKHPRRGPPPGHGPPPGAPGGPPHGPDGPGGHRPPAGPELLFGRDLYYFSILGTPSTTAPWMLQFGGHHLALNITLVGAHGVLTPTLTGAQPARYTQAGKTVRPLRGESDKALALLNSLDPNQRKQAITGAYLADLVLGPGQDGKVLQPEGLKAAAMRPEQRALLLDLIAEWTSILHAAAAAERLAELKADLPDTWFLWSGPTTAAQGDNIGAYYRIQGPHLVIEYAPQRDDPALHVHTMYRDPTNDYGRRLLHP